ncbi:MAG TPA: FCD domain-containing protein [Ferrovibrio sp.]|uniref:FCD domain-containing protein n=1 Tax=Ferrovibrio sp. TaxID=1917215 RepID=UPI002B4AD435|nr:FCD domain-containing protein [Ferrovibrio sp.]HLT78777.1 FCD domain-containing protein [Ferrovibrio sp.]
MTEGRRKADIRDLAAEAGSLTEFAYRNIRSDIIAGAYPPGAKLQIDDLKTRYGLSASPLREALARLISQGFVSIENQRGFRVSGMSRDDLADITLARQVIETAALKLAVERGDDSWEAGILAAYHRLDRYVLRLAGRPVENLAEFGELHKAFHTALLAACGSPRLLEEQSRLYDQAERYRHGMMQSYLVEQGVGIMDEHRQLMNLVLARNTDAACAMLHQHLGHTYNFCFGDSGQTELAQTAPP